MSKDLVSGVRLYSIKEERLTGFDIVFVGPAFIQSRMG